MSKQQASLILVTRPGLAGETLCAQIEAHGGSALHFPVIAFAPPRDDAAFDASIHAVGEQDWLIFNSPQAVIAVVPRLRAAWPNLPETVKFAAVGAGTAAALHEAGYQAALYPENEWSSEGLLAMPEFQTVTDQCIMIMRGEGGRELLEKVLLERGAKVSSCLAYQRVLPDSDPEVAIARIRQRAISMIVAGSFESVTNLKTLLGESCWSLLKNIPLIVMSERVKKLAAELGFKTIWVTRNASPEALLELILDKKGNDMSEHKVAVITQDDSARSSAQSGKSGVLVSLAALVLVAAASVYGYVQLSQMNMMLTSSISALRQQATLNQREIDSLHQALASVQQTAATLTAVPNANKWQVAEAQHLARLAEQSLNIMHDVPAALMMLQDAQQILNHATDAAVAPIRQALAENIAVLQAQPQVSQEQIYLQMNAIYNEIDHLPLPATPLQTAQEENLRSKDYSEAPWWKIQWHKSMDAIRKIVIVRYTDGNDTPLIMPEEKMYLYQNLHAQMQAAMLSVMNRNNEIFQTSLLNMLAWVQKYFVQDAQSTVNVLNQLRALQQVNLQPPAVEIATTLQLFDQYLAQNGQVETPAVTS